ncbi:fungal trans domain containing protein [Fusarium albosuccineum]|uniref:Fungal trans domain containing protein n=1 Tax=Fusarium albosuccineum TaxID=1237068 RepID=A0A8H4L911_9HYPO|nr:fungal trans domain containing protein [Fusarium albosuccineum]
MEQDHSASALPATPPRSQRGTKRKRRRIQTACKSCQDRKTRCDGNRPACSACHRRGVGADCIYESFSASASYISSLEERLQRLEQCRNETRRRSSILIQDLVEHRAIPQNDASFNQASPDTQGASTTGYSPNTSRYASNVDGLATVSSTTESECLYGPSSTIAFVQFAHKQTARPDETTSLEPELEQQPDDQPTSIAIPEAIRDKDPAASVFPPRRTTDDFIRCFWEFVHPVFPVLHKTSFMKKYGLLWSAEESEMPNPRAEMDDAIFSSTLNLVLAIGCKFSESVPASNRASLAQTFYQRSRSIYRFEVLDSMSLPQVQMLLLTGVYLQSTQQATRCWNVIGMAIRVAQSVGLHVESPNQKQSQMSREMRRRVWHTCLVLDKLLSMTFGRPAMISTSWNVPFPSLIDDEYLSLDGEGTQPQGIPSRLGLLVWSSKLFLILDDILLNFNAPHPSKSVDTMTEKDFSVQQIISDVLTLNRRIDKFSESIPAYLRLEPEREPMARQQEKPIYSSALVETALTLNDQVPFQVSVLVLVFGHRDCRYESSQAILQSLRLDSTADDRKHPRQSRNYLQKLGLAFITFASAVTIVAARICPAVDAATLASFDMAWNHCLVILEYYKAQIPAADRAISTLQELRSRIDLSLSQGFHRTFQNMASPTAQDQQQMASLDLAQLDPLNIDSALGIWLSQDMDNLGWLEFQ